MSFFSKIFREQRRCKVAVESDPDHENTICESSLETIISQERRCTMRMEDVICDEKIQNQSSNESEEDVDYSSQRPKPVTHIPCGIKPSLNLNPAMPVCPPPPVMCAMPPPPSLERTPKVPTSPLRAPVMCARKPPPQMVHVLGRSERKSVDRSGFNVGEENILDDRSAGQDFYTLEE
eukprot:TRINITY_DN853_c0_g1_i1.p1 TRINITY_DN853_c0_g1~~TRINITY_DN853_c0_g1_i1.p1  ORF type:complete len:178 (+),score=37.53 TRINITY_DN853_c0_g1_i1:169-702(+)